MDAITVGLAVFAAMSAVIQGMGLFIIKDIAHRINRIEEMFVKGEVYVRKS